MFGKSWMGSYLAWVLGVAVTVLTGSALGQTVTAGTPVVSRNIQRPGATAATDSSIPLTLTRADCKNPDLEYTFKVNIKDYVKGQTLEVWAGNSAATCSDQISWIPTQRTCWKLGTLPVQNGSVATGKYTPKELFGITAQSGVPVIPSCDYKDGNPARQSFNIFFFFTLSAKVQGTAFSQPIWYDMGAPLAPTDVHAGVAENALKVSWTAVDDQSDIVYRFYCAKDTDVRQGDANCASAIDQYGTGGGASGVGGTTSTTGGTSTGGTTSTSGTGGTSTGGTTEAGSSAGGSSAGGSTATTTTSSDGGSSGSAGSDNGGAASLADQKDVIQCGEVRGRNNTSGYTDRKLSNGISWAVSVTAVDVFGNESDPSAPTCNTPLEVDTFFERYRAEGGKAGGGFCSFAPGRGSLPAAALVLFGLAAVTQLRRRSRRH